MGYYFVLLKDDCNSLLLEDLSSKRKMEVEQISFDTLVKNAKEKTQILKILPSDFILSPFTNGKMPYVFEGGKVLFEISAVMQLFTQESKIEQNSILELSDWQLLK